MKITLRGTTVGLVEQLEQAEPATKELSEMWGGRMPTWEEFKSAHRRGSVRTNKRLALRAVWNPGVSKVRAFLYFLVVPSVSFLVIPATIALCFVWRVSYWWILASVVIVPCLLNFSVSRTCEAVKDGAADNEQLYSTLLYWGGVSFAPEETVDNKDVIRELDSSIVRDLAQMWGGRMPTWEEFKLADERGVVSTNKSLAYKVFWDVGVPKFRALVFGFIIPVAGALIVLAAPVVLSIMGKLSYWLIPVIWILGFWLLFKVCAIAACEAVKDRAVRNQKIYESLVKRGGFSFAPQELASQLPNFGKSKQ